MNISLHQSDRDNTLLVPQFTTSAQWADSSSKERERMKQ